MINAAVISKFEALLNVKFPDLLNPVGFENGKVPAAPPFPKLPEEKTGHESCELDSKGIIVYDKRSNEIKFLKLINFRSI